MKSKMRQLAAITLVPAAMLTFTSCSSTPEGHGFTMVAAQQGVPGGVIVQTFKTTATVDRSTSNLGREVVGRA
jgi:hypothetical protein